MLLILTACGASPAPEAGWLDLSEGARPSPTPLLGGLRLRPAEPGDGAAWWVEQTIEPADWHATAHPRVWWTPRRVAPEGGPASGQAVRLSLGGEEVPREPRERLSALGAEDLPTSGFAGLGARLFVARPDEEPPGAAVLSTFVSRGFERDGRWRVSVDRYGADGLSLWPGERLELDRELPADGALSLTALRQPCVVEGDAPVRLRVLLDDELLAEVALADARPRHLRLPLPRSGRARLAFEVSGPPAVVALANVVLGPLPEGSAARRRDPRPDLVLFLADTLRADVVGALGDESGLTPALDAFARRAVVFPRAWSPSSWTLPAQVSMMTALHPHQHGATTKGGALPAELVTLAEALRAAGYRTGAVTDQGFVTRATHMDHGFEWFDEHWGTLEDTLEAARRFLDADDGRPLFLFVQSYHTHVPYVVSEATRAELAGRLDLGDFAATEHALVPDESYWVRGGPLTAERAAALTRYRDLYRATVVELDRAFGAFLEDLDARGLDDAAVVFTSDHGEAFYEHETLGHGVGVWEELTRIPLMIRAPGHAPRRDARAAGLLDLPRTFATLAGGPPAPGWGGTDLLALAEERAVLSFECNNRGGASSIALVDGDRKVLFAEGAATAGALQGAYDLAADPGERSDLRDEGWAAELLRARARLVEDALTPVVSAASASLGAAERRNLEDLGYF